MRRWQGLVLSTGLLLIGHANVFAVTLLDVTCQTLATNPDLLASQANRQARYDAIRQAQAGYLPQVAVRVASGSEAASNPDTIAQGNENITLNRTEMSLNARQYVFDGWGVPSLVKESKYTSKVADYQYCDTRDNVIIEVVDAFLNVKRQREIYEITKITVAAHQDILSKMEKRYKAGAGDRTDVALAAARLARAEAQRAATQIQLEDAITRYTAVTGKVPPENLQMPVRSAKYIPPNLFNALTKAMTRNPNVLGALAQVVASDAHVGSAMSHFFPNVDLEVNLENDQNLNGIPGRYKSARGLAVINYNLYAGGADQAAFNIARAERLKAIREAEKIKRDIRTRVRNAWTNLTGSVDLVRYTTESVKTNTMVVADYKKQFTLGERQLFNVLDAQNDLFNAQVANVNARYDNASSYYHVLSAIGNISPCMLS